MNELERQARTYGASDLDLAEMQAHPERALAALQVAVGRGANNPIRYALALVRDPSWRATQGALRVNVSSVRGCETCDGDRVILSGEWNPLEPYAEVYVRCPECNGVVAERSV